MPTLHWLTRDEDLRTASRVSYRLLEEAPDLSAGEPDTGNMLIQGDNLEALKALLPFYAGRVKCICHHSAQQAEQEHGAETRNAGPTRFSRRQASRTARP